MDLRPVLFLDLDQTLRYSKADPKGFIKDKEDIAIYPDVLPKLKEYQNKDYILIGITNQGSVAFGYKTVPQIVEEIQHTESLLERRLHTVYACYTHEQGTVEPFNVRSLGRKPNIGMLAMAEKELIELSGISVDYDNSIFVGDRNEDKQCAHNAGIKFIHANEFFNRT